MSFDGLNCISPATKIAMQLNNIEKSATQIASCLSNLESRLPMGVTVEDPLQPAGTSQLLRGVIAAQCSFHNSHL